jgi:hypothetical protein
MSPAERERLLAEVVESMTDRDPKMLEIVRKWMAGELGSGNGETFGREFEEDCAEVWRRFMADAPGVKAAAALAASSKTGGS